MFLTPSMRSVAAHCALAAGLACSAAVVVAAQAPGRSGGQAPAADAPARPAPEINPQINRYYTLGPDSLEREGVPKGEVRGPFYLLDSPNYPGTQHTYWVYVPAQYNPAEPADLMIFQDGQAFIDMVKDPDYQRAVRHRNAAIADSRLIRCAEQKPGNAFVPGS